MLFEKGSKGRGRMKGFFLLTLWWRDQSCIFSRIPGILWGIGPWYLCPNGTLLFSFPASILGTSGSLAFTSRIWIAFGFDVGSSFLFYLLDLCILITVDKTYPFPRKWLFALKEELWAINEVDRKSSLGVAILHPEYMTTFLFSFAKYLRGFSRDVSSW